LDVTAGTSVMIGNSFDTDIMGAYNAGIPSMIINSDITEDQQKFMDENNYHVRKLSSLIDLMNIL
jgi:putative hydrolase of the HAD superfamily